MPERAWGFESPLSHHNYATIWRRAVRFCRAARAFCFTIFARLKHVKTNVVEKSQWGRELEVEIDAERMDKELNRAYRTYQKRVEIPGFRKGKVPLRIIVSRYGDSIRSEVIGDMLPTFLEEATREAGLVPAAPPQIAKLDHEPGSALTFTATLDIWPEIELETYEGLEITRMVHEIADDEIEGQLKELQNRQAAERAVERPLEKGDVLIADLQRLDDEGEPVADEKFDERYFLIGDENAPSPEFEEALVGISAGEERKVKFAYREDLPNEELAGKTEHFEVKAREVRERTLPELDDEFAKDLGEQFQTLDDLRDNIREQITGRWSYMSQQRERSDLIGQLIEKNPFDLPESMVDNYLRSMQQQQNQHHDHDHDHDHDHAHDEKAVDEGVDEEKKQEYRDIATRRVRLGLVLAEIGQQNKLEVGPDEINREIMKMARNFPGQERQVLEFYQNNPQAMQNLRAPIFEDKVIDFIAEMAKVTEKAVSPDELAADPDAEDEAEEKAES